MFFYIISFYRYVIEPAPQFTSSGELANGPMAKFSNMPGAPLLTQNMLVPDNWMVESIASPHDLDNIKLDQVDSNVHRYYIKSIIKRLMKWRVNI